MGSEMCIRDSADITIYTSDENYETMFSVPRYVLKGGELVVEDHELRQVVTGKTLSLASRTPDLERVGEMESWLEENYSLKPAHYGIGETEFSRVTRM